MFTLWVLLLSGLFLLLLKIGSFIIFAPKRNAISKIGYKLVFAGYFLKDDFLDPPLFFFFFPPPFLAYLLDLEDFFLPLPEAAATRSCSLLVTNFGLAASWRTLPTKALVGLFFASLTAGADNRNDSMSTIRFIKPKRMICWGKGKR